MREAAERIGRIADLPAEEWDALDAHGNPFLRHAFLAALESTGCVGTGTGWTPAHLAIRDSAGRLAGAVPMYAKNHSWGEFVFDWHWAEAHARLGLDYYPKLLAAVPFTPVTGPRLLLRPAESPAARLELALRLLEVARESGVSGLHVNFTNEADQEALEAAGFLRREDCRFQWCNRGYRDFETFLARLRADKRKKLRRERRRVAEAGVVVETLAGEEIDASLWARIFAFSERTFLQHGNAHYLSAGFLQRVAACLPGAVVVKLARISGEAVAAGVFFRDRDCLYGRYWGASRHVDCLHFELCYYQGIDYCLEQGLARFDPGTQGEHKLARGFEPVLTHSAHWLQDPRLSAAIARHLAAERSAVRDYRDAAEHHLPFQRNGPA